MWRRMGRLDMWRSGKVGYVEKDGKVGYVETDRTDGNVEENRTVRYLGEG